MPTPFSPEAVEAILDAFDRRTEQTSPSLDALEKCLETLSEKSRRLLALRYGRSWSVRRIAEHIGSTPAAAHKALSRLRTRIHDCVQRRLGLAKEVD